MSTAHGFLSLADFPFENGSKAGAWDLLYLSSRTIFLLYQSKETSN